MVHRPNCWEAGLSVLIKLNYALTGCTPLIQAVRFSVDSISSQAATPITELRGDQFGELDRDVWHRILSRTQAASGGEHRTDFPKSLVRRAMHNGYEPVSCQKYRQLFVGDTLTLQTKQQRRGDQHDTDSRLSQSSIDFAEQLCAEADVHLTEPDRDTACLELIVKFLSRPCPVIPRMAEEVVPTFRQDHQLLDGFADRR